METLLYRIWVTTKDLNRFEQIIQNLSNLITTSAVIPGVLTQYDILLTKEELLVLTLSFNQLEAMRVEIDDHGSVIYMLSDQEL
jgi:hypothetical protein